MVLSDVYFTLDVSLSVGCCQANQGLQQLGANILLHKCAPGKNTHPDFRRAFLNDVMIQSELTTVTRANINKKLEHYLNLDKFLDFISQKNADLQV